MENPFAETLRAFGVPMLGDDQRKAGQSGYGPPPLISSAPGILPPPDWSADFDAKRI